MRTIVLTLLASLVFFSSSVLANVADNSVTYDFTVPYSGAGMLTISNNSSNAIVVSKINFNVNTTINIGWGPLANNATLTSRQNPDGLTTDYTYTENKPVSIAANSAATLTYSYTTATGVLNVGMPPEKITLTLNDGKQITPAVSGKCQGAACNDPTPGYRVVGYFADWKHYRNLSYNAKDIPVNHINTIDYAFIDFDENGNVSLFDNYADTIELPEIAMLLRKYPYLHASLSFGGWTLSHKFSAMANNPAALKHFVNNAVAAMREVGFNGINIDWEYPVANGAPHENPPNSTPYDAKNIASLLTKLRAALDAAGKQDSKTYYLTITGMGGVDKVEAISKADPTAWQQITKAINYNYVMTYDFHGGFDKGQQQPYNVTDFMSAMALDPNNDPTVKDSVLKKYNVEDIINKYLQLGFKPKQLVLGIPAYGRLVDVASTNNDALYQVVTGTPMGEYDTTGSANTGMFDYACIEGTCYGKALPNDLKIIRPSSNKTSLTYYAQTPFAYSISAKQFLTFDDVASVKYKTNWAKRQGLGGVMFWELSGDLPVNNPSSLIATAYQVLTAP